MGRLSRAIWFIFSFLLICTIIHGQALPGFKASKGKFKTLIRLDVKTDAIKGKVVYHIYRSKIYGEQGILISETNCPVSILMDTDVEHGGKSYYYTIEAILEDGSIKRSRQVEGYTTPFPKPQA